MFVSHHLRTGFELTFFQAREVVIIATGSTKALAIKKCVEDGTSHMWTASCLQNHPCAMIVVDEDATLELQVKTVKVCASIWSRRTSLTVDFSTSSTLRRSLIVSIKEKSLRFSAGRLKRSLS